VRELSHMWQRLLLASSLLFGLLVGVASTVFAYSNRATVDVGFSVFHLYGVPLWTVAVVPVAIVLIAGTLYHWYRSLYHFTEHMRHRHRVHELEGELTRVRANLDQLLEMPDHAAPSLPVKHIDAEPAKPAISKALPEPVASNGEAQLQRKTAAGRPQAEPSQAPVQEP